jgi:hypothetical protein
MSDGTASMCIPITVCEWQLISAADEVFNHSFRANAGAVKWSVRGDSPGIDFSHCRCIVLQQALQPHRVRRLALQLHSSQRDMRAGGDQDRRLTGSQQRMQNATLQRQADESTVQSGVTASHV